MKKIIFIFLTVLIAAGVNSQQNPNNIETLLPKNALIIAQTNEIKKTIISANRLINGYLDDGKLSILKSINEFRDKTGIDLMDYESLSENGIDITRKAAIAFYAPDRKSKENIVIILPIYDEKAFPLKFTEIIKKMKSGGELDAYPVITPYKAWKIYQIRKDMFASTTGGYFILAPKGELVMKTLDTSVNIDASAATDTVYNSYKLNAGLAHDLNIYIKKDFLADFLGPKKKPAPVSDDNAGIEDKAELINAAYDVALKEKKKKPSGGVKGGGDDILNAFDYISVAASFEDNLLKLVAGANFNGSDAGASTLLNLFSTGNKNEALYFKDYFSYVFLSLDLNSIEKYCQGNTDICKMYNDAKKEFKKNLGVDFSAEFLPDFKGVINFIITEGGDDKDDFGKMVLFLPMKSPAASKTLMDKASAHLSKGLKEKLKKKNISGATVFWIEKGGDKNENKIMFFYSDKGIFVVNDEKLVDAALKATLLGDGAASELSGNITPDMFMYSDANPSFVDKAKVMLKKMSPKYSEMLNMIQGLNLIGRKKGTYMTIEVDLDLKKIKKK